MWHLFKKRNILITGMVCGCTLLLIFAVTRIIALAAGGNDVSYRLGSTGDITYKENENKVYYTRKHFSSGSSIRYYTMKFVISLHEVSAYDDLSSLSASGNDYSMELTVALNGTSVKEKDADKTADFYWYDSDEADDDGYITTTYVIDGNLLLGFLENAALRGKRGTLYIHHVFAVTGGSNDDSWHRENKAVNDVPFYRYNDLFKLSWNNTAATLSSQEACMNIPIPFKSFCEVYTAYYNEYGRVIRQERGTMTGRTVWLKTVPYIINGVNGKKYASIEPATRKDVNGNIMMPFYVYSTDPENRDNFPSWDPEQDRQSANGGRIKTIDAVGSYLIRYGYRQKTDSVYSFSLEKENVYRVILYIPVTDAENDLTPGTTPGPDITPVPEVTMGPDVTPYPDITPYPNITLSPSPTYTEDPEYAESELTVKYFVYDRDTGNADCIKLEHIVNTESLTGKYAFNQSYTVKLSETIYKNGAIYEPASVEGVLYGDNASILASGNMGFTETFNLGDDKIYGISSGSLRKEDGFYVDFETGDMGGFCTVYIMCSEVKPMNSMLIRYIDDESGEIVSERIIKDFFDGAKLYWHGINGKLSWAYKVKIGEPDHEDGVSFIPVFNEEGAYEVISGKCASGEAVHEHFGGALGNDVTWYCTTCGKVKRITYFTDSPYAADAVTNVYDNNSATDPYHSYRFFLNTGKLQLREGYLYGTYYSDIGQLTNMTYESLRDCEYDYDPSSDTLWIAVAGDLDSGNQPFTFEPEKETPYTAGVIYIPCVRKELRKPIHIHISDDNLKYVQYHYAQKELPQVVLGKGEFHLIIDEYGDDVSVEFDIDILTPDDIRIKAGTKHIPYPYYKVPSDTKEGIYSVKAEVTDTLGNVIYTDEAFFEVSGRLFGLKLYNVSSENIEWKGVFDDPDAGYEVSALPLVDGDSPNVKNLGMLKSGYIWSFSLETAGSRMLDNASSVRVITGFTHISSDGTRKPVDIWYEKYDENGQENFVKADFMTEAVREIENGRVWIFEYSLPDTWYCVVSGFDMEEYLDLYDGCTFEESFWERDGYLAVNFRIEALAADGTVIMSYSNLRENVEAGMCDMWESEGFAPEKTDVNNTVFPLEEGDVILVRIPGSTIKKGSGVPDPPTNSKEDNMIRSGGYPYLSLPM